jgi:hypothetical protein
VTKKDWGLGLCQGDAAKRSAVTTDEPSDGVGGLR